MVQKKRISKNKFGVLILAGGLGTRMKSELPKVLHPVNGTPVIGHILKSANALAPKAIGVVVGHKFELVKETVSASLEKWGISCPVHFIHQKKLTGSGQAVKESLSFVKKHREAVILCGDTPLVTAATLSEFVKAFYAQDSQAAVLTARVPDPSGYGRIIKDAAGNILRIVEHSDADPSELAVDEINSGMYIFTSRALSAVMGRIKPKGPKKEIYLTEAVELISSSGGTVAAAMSHDFTELLGINSRVQLAYAERILRFRVLNSLMENGVTIIDPDTTYIQDGVKIGRDTVINPGAAVCGGAVIGENCVIGQNVFIKNCVIQNGVEIKFGSYLADSKVLRGCAIGPYAHIRPGCEIGPDAKVGNFTELKAAKVGAGSKVPHLSYVGDAELREKVNIGAGTITCNYDGVKKHRTFIGKGAFIGSNTNLVAPVSVGAGAKIGAGSTITHDVPAGTLAIARARQVVIRKHK